MESPTQNQPESQKNPARYLAIDPGETYGWASFDAKGEVVNMGQFHWHGDIKTLDNLIGDFIHTVIVEDYKNFGWMQQKKWTKNQTSKNIGKIEAICELKGIKLELQPNTVKSIGYMWAGRAAPKNHSISHQYDAFAHGVYYLQSKGIRSAILSIPPEDR